MAEPEREQDEDMEEEPGGRSRGRFAAGLLCGVVVGAGLALLFAPQRGDQTRRHLRRRLERLRETTSDGITRADALRRELQRRREAR